jgi:hypothetical protein
MWRSRPVRWLADFLAEERVAAVETPPWIGRGAGRLPTLLAILVGLVVVGFVWNRYLYGTELTDESFSIALPYRFVLGDRPFVEEVSIQQTSGILLLPFVWLWVKITGGTTGIVLFCRFIHLAIKGLAGVCVYALGKRWLANRSAAIAIAFTPIAFTPHSIPNVGYNSLGLALTACGTMLAAAAVATPSPNRRLLFLSGLALGLCAYAYPPMVGAPLVAALLLPLCLPGNVKTRARAFAAFALGGALAFALVAPSLMYGGVAGVKHSLNWGVHAGGPKAEHAKEILQMYEDHLPPWWKWAVAGVVLVRILRWRPLVLLAVPALTLAVLFQYHDEMPTFKAALHTSIYLATFAPLMLVIARPDKKVWRGVPLILFPAGIAAAASGFVSTQLYDAIGLAGYSIAILFLLLGARAIEHAAGDRTFAQLPAFALMFVMLLYNYEYVYRDQPMAQLVEKTKVGPFKGIWTTEERAKMSEEMLAITRQFDNPNGRMVVLYDHPGFFLFSKMRPNAECVWEVHYYGQQSLLDFWRAHESPNSISIHIKGTQRGVIDGTLFPPERKVLDTHHFEVFRDP